MTIQLEAIEQCCYVVLFIMLYKVVLTLKSVNKTLVCDHSNESYGDVLSYDAVNCAMQSGYNCELKCLSRVTY